MEKGVMDQLQDSFVDLVDRGVDFLPKLLVAVLLLVVGVFLANLVSKWIGKGLDYIETNEHYKNILKRMGIKAVSISGIVALLAKWTVLLIFISAAVDVLELSVLTDTFQSIVDFAPNIFATALIAALVFVAGNVIQDIVEVAAKNAKVTSYSALGTLSKVIVYVFGVPLAASQLGLDLSIINNNLTVIVAGVMLAFALAFGLGGKDVARQIVEDLYKKLKK